MYVDDYMEDKSKNNFFDHVLEEVKVERYSSDDNPVLATGNQEEIDRFKLNHVDSQIIKPIIDILLRYSDVFDDITTDNLPNLTFDSLDLTTTNPIQTAIYRFPPVYNDVVKDEMQRLLKLNIISHSKSPYNSPVWIVPKKDGDNGEKNHRVVIDYRKLNKVTVQDNFPLPNIADIIDQLGGAKFFSVMDLVSGFHQIALKPSDRPKTAFSVLGSHYEFNRLPFGLINSAPAFQRIMSRVLEGLVGSICFVYIDDIVVYGSTLEEHNYNLAVVLQRLSKNKLKVKASKCHFLKEEIVYLGFVISKDGVKMDQKKVQAIKNLVEPTDTKQLKSFLGMAGFYRKFIPSFSLIASPLHHLLKKGVVFDWNDECQFAFKRLIEVMCKDIVLQYPDFKEIFYLTTDASNFGIGAVISQKNNSGYDQPIAFISRSLIAAEQNYSVTEKECLAIIWGVYEFRHYLTGRKFTILSDHRPLVWLDNVIDPGARLLRWRLKLNNYNYEIQYTPGKTNFVADELSRNGFCNFIENNPKFLEKIVPSVRALVDIDDYDNAELISEDEDEPESFDFHQAKNREIIENEDSIMELIKEQHSGPIGGHRGINATEKSIKLFFDIKNLREKVTGFIKSCDICQRTKSNRQHRRLPLMITSTVSEPNMRIAFDIIGPFKYPDGRKLYGLTIQDEFSKFIQFCGIKDCTADKVAAALVENWILCYGIPKILVSDNGSNLCGDIMTGISEYFNIKRITTSIAHPLSNASVERAHGRLAEFIRATDTEIEQSVSWEQKLKLASFCYNTTVHSTTGYTPYFLMFGRQARPITGVARQIDLLPDTYLDNFNKNLKTVWEKAKQNIEHNKKSYIEKANAKIVKFKTEEYKKGDKVMVEYEVFKGKCNRTVDPWDGPYVVAEVTDTNLLIKKRNRTTLVNRGRCKPYVEPIVDKKKK